MDVATVVITASFVIVVLQVITLVILFNTRTRMSQGASAPAHVHDGQDFRRRRGEDTKFIKRPEQEQQRQRPHVPPQQQPPQEVDHVEKSLRDINLRLKNAERDQERARKRMRDGGQGGNGQGGSGQGGGGPQNQGQRRFDQQRPRRDDNFRGHDRPRHQFNQNRGHEQPQQTEGARPPEPQQPPPALMPASMPVRNDVPPSAPAVQAPVQKENIEILPENTEILHGRKVLVRRRVLKEEGEAGQETNGKEPAGNVSDAMPAQASAPVPSAEAPAEQQPEADQSQEQNIQFGR
jgi:hypothetical protein